MVIKKNGQRVKFNAYKILKAIEKAADRARVELSEEDRDSIVRKARESYSSREGDVEVSELHELAIEIAHSIDSRVAYSYQSYRDYKTKWVTITDKMLQKEKDIRYRGDRSNANTDSALVSTKRCLVLNAWNKEMYKLLNLRDDEVDDIEKGYYYIHDLSARRDTFNCSVNDVGNIMKGGFWMGNIFYNEPKTLDTAFDVIGDIILSNAAQQYGGYTVPEVDTILSYYAKKSFDMYLEEQMDDCKNIYHKYVDKDLKQQFEDKAWRKVIREAEQGYQGIEIKLNTVASSRGDYPFVTWTFGLGTDPFEIIISDVILRVHAEGQGAPGKKKPVLFPKLVFLYDENVHGKGKVNHDVFENAVDCSCKTMYPDFLSLTGDGFICGVYKDYHRAIQPMGCRAFAGLWWENGGVEPRDDNDKPIVIGRNNVGAISLNLPMIYQQSKIEDKDFFKLLKHYLDKIMDIHVRTYEYLGEMPASVNPLSFCEGGLYGGNLGPNDKIAPVLKQASCAIGITALDELQKLYNGKSRREDQKFSNKVLKFIEDWAVKAKKRTKRVIGLYGTPAESLLGTQREQFVKEYGIIEGVSDKEYFSNSFHLNVAEDVDPFTKQDLEYYGFHHCNAGHIQYTRQNKENRAAVETTILRAMRLGYYAGTNFTMAYCDECGAEDIEEYRDDNGDRHWRCRNCGSECVTVMERVCGYMGYSQVNGNSRVNEAKIAEQRDRISM